MVVRLLLLLLATAWGTLAWARPQAEPPAVGGIAVPSIPGPLGGGPVGGGPGPGVPATAPPRGESVQTARAESERQRPVEQPPEIFYLPDDGGRLVPVPGFQYRDCLELLGLRDRLPGVPRPRPEMLKPL